MYEGAISEEEKVERIMNKAVSKWLVVPSSVALKGKGILELPMTSLVEVFKCAKTSLEMALFLTAGPLDLETHEKRFQHAQGALQHREHYWGGFLLGPQGHVGLSSDEQADSAARRAPTEDGTGWQTPVLPGELSLKTALDGKPQTQTRTGLFYFNKVG